MTDIFTQYEGKIARILHTLCDLNELPLEAKDTVFTVEPPRDHQHGDIACNIAMILAKKLKRAPQEVAQLFVEKLTTDTDIIACDIAGAGFINVKLANRCWHNIVIDILSQKNNYGKCNLGNNDTINIEFVSANPTGPLHIAHARGAVFGDVLASILNFCGYRVTKEYYVNDSGSQITILIESFFKRYQQCCGMKDIILEEGLYPGQYLLDLAQILFEQDGKKWLDCNKSQRDIFFRTYVIHNMVENIKNDLVDLNIEFDVFFYESILLKRSKENSLTPLENVIKALQKQNMVYHGVLPPPKGEENKDWQPREQLIFRSTEFGDDIDRPLFKEDGSPTYFVSDIAYHYDKYLRGFNNMIDVLGADHAGYLKRIKASVEAMSQQNAHLEIRVCQLVRLMRNKQTVRMSKRSGEFVTLKEVIQEVGSDALRFILLLRKNDAPIDFDLDVVKKQNADNPVFYLQYAYARIFSVKRHAKSIFNDTNLDITEKNVNLLLNIKTKEELSLIKKMSIWPKILKYSAKTRQPHRLVFYLYELAAEFHQLWNLGKKNENHRFVHPENIDNTKAKLALLDCLAIIFAIGMDLIKIEKRQNM